MSQYINKTVTVAALDLRSVLSFTTGTLGSWVEIPTREWTMSALFLCLCIPRSVKTLRGSEGPRNLPDIYKYDSEIRVMEGFELQWSVLPHKMKKSV
jgi:hypothetical protein